MISFHRTALSRQLKEAVRIRRRGGEGSILNSKGEYNRCYIPRLELEPQAPVLPVPATPSAGLDKSDQDWERTRTTERVAMTRWKLGGLPVVTPSTTRTSDNSGLDGSTTTRKRRKLKHCTLAEDWGEETLTIEEGLEWTEDPKEQRTSGRLRGRTRIVSECPMSRAELGKVSCDCIVQYNNEEDFCDTIRTRLDLRERTLVRDTKMTGCTQSTTSTSVNTTSPVTNTTTTEIQPACCSLTNSDYDNKCNNYQLQPCCTSDTTGYGCKLDTTGIQQKQCPVVFDSSSTEARAVKPTTDVSDGKELTKQEIKEHLVVKFNNLWKVGDSTSEVARPDTDDTMVGDDTIENVDSEISSDTLDTSTPSRFANLGRPGLVQTLDKDDIRSESEDYHNRSLLREGFHEEIRKSESGPDTKETAQAEQNLYKKGSGGKVVNNPASHSARILARDPDLNILAREPGLTDTNIRNKNTQIDPALVTTPKQDCNFKRGGMCNIHNTQGKKYFTTTTNWKLLRNGLYGNVTVRKTNWSSLCQPISTSVGSQISQPRDTDFGNKKQGVEISGCSVVLESEGLVKGSSKRIWSEMFNTSQSRKL